MVTPFYFLLLLCLVQNVEPFRLLPKIGSDYFSSRANLFRFPLTLRKGTIGINLLGFHVSAGLLGGLLAENAGAGGPHAEASTPFGQSAGAGIGFRVHNGTTIYYLYADAQLGSDITGVCVLLSRQYKRSVKILNWSKCASEFNIKA